MKHSKILAPELSHPVEADGLTYRTREWGWGDTHSYEGKRRDLIKAGVAVAGMFPLAGKRKRVRQHYDQLEHRWRVTILGRGLYRVDLGIIRDEPRAVEVETPFSELLFDVPWPIPSTHFSALEVHSEACRGWVESHTSPTYLKRVTREAERAGLDVDELLWSEIKRIWICNPD